jgi:hypothetical protein
MSLSNFTTLELAKLHPDYSYIQISPGISSQYFGLSGMLDVLEANTANSSTIVINDLMTPTVGSLCRTILNSARTTGFASDPTTPDGAGNRAASQLLVNAGIGITQPHLDAFWELALVKNYPYANATQADFDEANDAGEVIALIGHIGQHNVKVYTALEPRKATTLSIEQRFGTDAANLTDWHKVGSVLNVFYPTTLTGEPYTSGQIPTTSATYRELRLVSPLTLGVTLEPVE